LRHTTPAPLTILVVEDHAAFRRFICTTLQRRPDLQIVEAANGLEAVEMAAQRQPDLILLDLNLPILHGFEVAEQIPALAPRARLLFLSQESSSDIVRKALSLGACGYVQKISAGTDLLPGIDAALAGQRFISRSLAFVEAVVAPAPRRHDILFCPEDAAVVEGFARAYPVPYGEDDQAMSRICAEHTTVDAGRRNVGWP
jgi:DNA-binding NarL/FixJ family response regulator